VTELVEAADGRVLAKTIVYTVERGSRTARIRPYSLAWRMSCVAVQQ